LGRRHLLSFADEVDPTIEALGTRNLPDRTDFPCGFPRSSRRRLELSEHTDTGPGADFHNESKGGCTTSNAAGTSTSSTPSAVVLALFAFLTSWVVARYAFKQPT